ncbi:hypothetical protein NCS52_00167900 [Fusarium sp. LHS14.1]|nr:hypothetical protein NCS52_00167900 [Fusarium sp. LHS14.1]
MTMVQIPHLVATKASKQLVVKGKPFLMRAAELQNSSMTSAEYMDTVWQKLADMNINTVLGCVTWEMIEPVEGTFEFEELDKVILGARKHGLHLVLLWFGSFKNGLSTYVPGWVKTNPKRFPRAKLRKAGGVLQTGDVLSIFHNEAPEADGKAFQKLMAHIKEIDEAHSTVLMVQVENETGLLGDSRDGSDAANKKFSEPVPDELVEFLIKEWDNLRPDLQRNLSVFKSRAADTKNSDWEAVFGKSPQTDELFMAYHYAKYLNGVTGIGKKAYPIPHYTNVWLNYAGEDSDNDFPVIVGGGGAPGEYPSGGGTSNVLDIWQTFAPNLDFIAPDCYLTDYNSTCAKYRHRNQPLFIPEQRRDDYGVRRIWIAYGSYAAMGVSPFGIDTLEGEEATAWTKHYGLLKSVSAVLLESQCRGDDSVGFCFDELNEDGSDPSKAIIRQWGGFEIIIERCFVFGKPGTGSGIVIHKGDGKFLLIGKGFQIRARSLNPKATFTGILKFNEKTVSDEEAGTLRTLRMLNGDETRSGSLVPMPNEDPDYGGFPICVTIPARTMIAEVEFYGIED